MQLRAAGFFALILMVNGLMVGGAVGVGHVQPKLYDSPYVCMIFDGDSRTNGKILDLRTGLYHRDLRTRGEEAPLPSPGDLSPDHRYRAYLAWNNRPDGTSTLYLYPSAGGEIVVQDDVTSPFYFYWSPDSQQFAYTSATTLEVTLAIAHADGSDLRRVKIPTTSPLDTFVRGWSPDSRYLLISTQQISGRRWELWDTHSLTNLPLRTWDWVDSPQWSPDGRYFSYLATTNIVPALTMNIFSVDSLTEQPHALVSTVNNVLFYWSPTSRYVLAFYSAGDQSLIWYIDVFSVDGQEYHVRNDTNAINVPSIFPLDQAARWLKNGEQIVYFQQLPQDHQSLNLFTPTTGVTTHLVADLLRGPFVSPINTERIAFVERADGLNKGVVMDLDGNYRTTIFETDGDYGDAAWSADGKHLAFTWSTGSEAQGNRDVHLSWLKWDGTLLQEIHGYVDVKELAYAGDTLMFLAKASATDDFSVNQMNLLTGEVTTIGQPLAEVLYVDIDASGDYRVWWRDRDGNLGVDVYATDPAQPRERRFRFGLPQVLVRNPPAFFVASDGETAAIKFGQYGIGEYMQVSRADGSTPRIVSDKAIGLGDALWSPDGKLVAFTQALPTNGYIPGQMLSFQQITLEIYTAAGEHVRTIAGPSSWYGNLAWTTCE